MLTLLLLAQAADPMAQARTMLAAERGCAFDPDTTDVTVCGRRAADRFRVPLIVADLGDPLHEGVAAERTRLLARTTPLHDLGPFQVGGGFAGVTMTAGGGKAAAVTGRKLAP